NGTYYLSGSGLVSVTMDEYVGYIPGANGAFLQSGGSNSMNALFIGTSGSYTLSGGTLHVRGDQGTSSVYGELSSGALINSGTVDGGSSAATLKIDKATLDLTSGIWRNLGMTSVVMGTGTFTIVPKGFDTSTDFGSYSSLGLTRTMGTTLTVPPGSRISG